MKISKKSLLDQIIEEKLLMISKYPEKEKRIQLKNKSRTPLFLDTSKFQSFPDINERLNKFIAEMIKKNNISHDKIIGLPYGGTMFSYGVAHELKVPTLSIRKEGTKNYGTSGEILGIYKRGDTVLIIEDATVTAHTAIDFIQRIKKQGLLVYDIITIVDTGGPAKENLQKEGVVLHTIFTRQELYAYILKKNPQKISKKMKGILEKIIYGQHI